MSLIDPVLVSTNKEAQPLGCAANKGEMQERFSNSCLAIELLNLTKASLADKGHLVMVGHFWRLALLKLYEERDPHPRFLPDAVVITANENFIQFQQVHTQTYCIRDLSVSKG